MSVQLNHTIVHARDSATSAAFLAGILGLTPPTRFGPFMAVALDNGVTLDYADAPGEIASQHYAFLIDERGFDEAFGRIRDRGLAFWADPHRSRPGQINTNDGGRGVYFADPDGHLLELITRPYGSGS